VHAAAARGAAGVVRFGASSELEDAAEMERAVALARRIVRSVPERDPPRDENVWMWSRRFDGHRLLGVVNRSAKAVEAAVPQPPVGKTWFEWYAARKTRPLDPEACRLAAGRTLTLSTASEPWA
jgi:hypothetical protein